MANRKTIMNHLTTLLIGAMFSGLLITSCQSGSETKESASGGQVPEGYHKATAMEVIHASSYTYLKMDGGENGPTWIAVNKMEAEPGQVYYYAEGLEMNNFQSKELDRTFETIYFVQEITTEPPVEGQVPMAHKMVPPATQKDISITPAEGAVTIAEVYANKSDYAGEKVTVTGKVTKVNVDIMGKNWIHIQDGTSHEGDFDLTVTTMDLPAVEDTVTFIGTIALDKDFGAGYKYDVIMENAGLR